MLNPSDAEGTFVQCTKKRDIMKIILTLSCRYALDSSRGVRSDEYPCARVSGISQLFVNMSY